MTYEEDEEGYDTDGAEWRAKVAAAEAEGVDPMLKHLTKEEKKLIRCGRIHRNSRWGAIDVEPAATARIINGEWMLDTVLDAFAIRVNMRTKKLRLHHYVHCCYFIVRLRPRKEIKNAEGEVLRTEYGYDFKGVSKWTKKVPILTIRTFMFPVNIGDHWIVFIMDVERKRITVYDALSRRSSDLKKGIAGDIAKSYFGWVRWMRGYPFATDNFHPSSWLYDYDPPYPKQNAATSYGLFTLFAIEFLTREDFSDDRHAMTITPSFSNRQVDLLNKRLLISIRRGL